MIWTDLQTLQQLWSRVLLPAFSIFDMGASEAIYTSIQKEVLEKVSPIIYMRARKNQVERDGMRNAHIRDGVAMCESLSYLTDRVIFDIVIFVETFINIWSVLVCCRRLLE